MEGRREGGARHLQVRQRGRKRQRYGGGDPRSGRRGGFGGVRGLGDGAFAATLAARFPALPLCNESDLQDPSILTAFAVRLFCHHQWRHSPHPENALDTLRRRSEGLDEPLLSGTRRFIEHLAAPAR